MADKKETRSPDISDLVESSIREIEYFERTQVWQDMLKILEDWSNGLRGDYESADSMDQVRYTQGISMCINYVKNLPEAMKTIVNLNQEDIKDGN
jgi:hypothetical protein